MSQRNVQAGWEHFHHGADIGVRGWGPTKEEAFEQAAIALTAVVVQPDTVHETQAVRITCGAPDDELLLVDWLNAIIYEMSTQSLVFRSYRVQIDHQDLTAECSGEKVEKERHDLAVEVKGATYTNLAVDQDPQTQIWTAQCVVDV